MSTLESPSIALIGAGAMGGALVRGWTQAVRKGGGLTLTVVEPHFDQGLERELEAVGAVLNPPNPGPVDVVVLGKNRISHTGGLHHLFGQFSSQQTVASQRSTRFTIRIGSTPTALSDDVLGHVDAVFDSQCEIEG